MQHFRPLLLSLALGVTSSFWLAPPAAAQLVPNGDGTATLGPAAGRAGHIAVGRVNPWYVREGATLFSAGVGLRNRSGGAIEISGMEPGQEVLAAYLYWNVLSDSTVATPAPMPTSPLTIQRLSPTPGEPQPLWGEVVGTGGTPCWGGTRMNTVLRTRIRSNVLEGNGTYLITPNPAIFTNTDGSLPWGNPGSTLINGATLFMVTTGNNVVALYDAPLAGTDFVGSPGLTAQIQLPRAAWWQEGLRLHIVSSDGQTYAPYPEDTFGLSGEDTLVNGTAVGGPSASTLNTSDLNGADGGRMVQLWDTSLHDISSLVRSGARRFRLTFATDVPLASVSTDCLVAVALGVEALPGGGE